MIETIEVNNVATYAETQILSNLKKVNFIYGTNGSGKTTISRILDNPNMYPNCNIKWKDNNELPILVYNKDFVNEHFSESKTLKGVFTLGKNSIELQRLIEEKRNLINSLIEDKTQLEKTLQGPDGKQHELNELENNYCSIFWNKAMLPYKEEFKECLVGFRSNKKSFKDKVIEFNSSILHKHFNIDELKEKYNQLYNKTHILVEKINFPCILSLKEYEENTILTKKIIGREDIDISSMIRKLENSDWVRLGLQYYDKNNGICPFCQQKTEITLQKSLSEYFDETFENDISILNTLYRTYSEKAINIQKNIESLLEKYGDYIPQDKVKDKLELFIKTITNNLIKIKDKIKEPSRSIILETTTLLLNEFSSYINIANNEIEKYNQIVQHIEDEKQKLKEKVWGYILDVIRVDIISYEESLQNITKAIDSLNVKIKKKIQEIQKEKDKLEELEKSTTSVQPTCEQINRLLKSFGFSGFSLKVENDNAYKIIRYDGSLANETLSEGEKNFLTFLYFYSLINGSLTTIETGTNKIVVFDDPISSLDNDILFIVSSLIRNVIYNTNSEFQNIKQIIILTHNIYFHKEVSFKKNHNVKKTKEPERAFWIIKKRNNCSIIDSYQNTNPIISSYNALWLEIKADKPNPIALPNSMRRILENYFSTLGGISIDDLEDKFEGEEKVICRSLCSWIHSGSHTCFGDEYYSSLDDSQIIKYKDVFRKIFEYNHQIGHFNMMMNINDFDEGNINDARN